MARFVMPVVVALLVASAGLGQPEAAAQPDAGQQAVPAGQPAAVVVETGERVPTVDPVQDEMGRIRARAEMFAEMGVEKEAAVFLSVLAEGDDSVLAMLPLLAGQGDVDENVIGMLMFSRAMLGQKAGPATMVHDGRLLVVENGTVYKINLATMALEGKLRYRGAGSEGAMTALAPIAEGAREKGRATACTSNVKQIGLAVMMYVQDHGEVFPNEQWCEGLMPYLRNPAVLTCPSRTDLPVGYALNKALVGQAIGALPLPAETPLVFESNLGGPNPVGGPDAVPEEGVHDGMLTVGFADGHAAMVSPERVRQMLAVPLQPGQQ